MDTDSLEQRKFLTEQLQWCKDQDRILEEIEAKLYEMKEKVEFALIYHLTPNEVARINRQLDVLKLEVQFLEKQLHTVLH
ncbi:hypothetical protein [Bacillus sp. FJAT-22090]|uniref:hypothetical protein n=1 Tax=Bacillus sp. FJAT-22090 TaxID=1581038 RepID=UPI0011AAD8C4|nr:hypothetical protein [Bacillus sp. FJAT-22090]